MDQLDPEALNVNQNRAQITAVLCVGVFVTLIFLFPVINLVVYPFLKGGIDSVIDATDVLVIGVRTTVHLALSVAVTSSLFGLVAAWALFYLNSPRLDRLFLLSAIAAFSTLTIVRALAILLFLRPNYFVSDALTYVLSSNLSSNTSGPGLSSSFIGILIGLLHFVLPISILYLYVGCKLVPINLVRSAIILSGSRWRTLTVVFWPAMRGRIIYITGCIALLTVGAFVTPSVLGGASSQTISVAISDRMRTSISLDQAIVLGSLFSVGFACLSLVFFFLPAGAQQISIRLRARDCKVY